VTANDSADAENFVKIRTAYRACLDDTAIKAAGAAPLTKILQQIIQLYPVNKGNWTAPNSTTHTNQTGLPATMRFLRSYGVSSVVGIGANIDPKNPDTIIVSVAPSGLTLPGKQRYLEPVLLSNYSSVITQVVSALLPNESIAKSSLAAVAEFEKNLASIYPEASDQRDITVCWYPSSIEGANMKLKKTYNLMSVDDASAMVPEIDLLGLIKAQAPPNVAVTNVVVSSPAYMKSLSGVLANTTPDVLQAFHLWKAVLSFGGYISSDAMRPLIKFQNQVQGKVSLEAS
jgi:endothelin-converting enzyme